ncbi:AAA family ATPase [Nocardiopsis mangrovi]|uniref:AAA family ATPase n=1 Tax=Nocardiopsis mangrovi TaxID=1179818 RepID=A0ABV9E073_9ACTN
MQFAERESEIKVLTSMLATSEQGRGGAALITGPAGFGKTQTLHSFAGAATKSGVTHLSATCLRNEQNISLGVVHQILQALGGVLGEIPSTLKILHEAAFSAAPDGIKPDDLNWIGVTQGLWELITNRARQGTVLITVDDVHYADSISFEILLHFINRIHTENILMVFTSNEGPNGVPFRIQTDLMYHPNCHRMRITPYSLDMISGIARRHLGIDTEPPVVEEIHRVSGGNALLAHSLIDDQRNAAGAPGGLVAADGFSGSIRTLLRRIGPTTLRIVHATAVLDTFASPALLADMLYIKQETVTGTLDWLTAVGLFGPDGFRHPAAKAAVLDSIEPELHRELNGRAAQVLHARGIQATVIAGHILDDATLNAPWTMDVLREAADQALSTSEYELAVRYLRHAVLLSSGDERVSLTLALAKAEWRINPASAVPYTPMLLQAARDGRLHGGDIHWLLMCMLWHGQNDEAMALHALLQQAEAEQESEGGDAAVWRLAAEHWLAATHPPVLHRLTGSYRPSPLGDGNDFLLTGLYGKAVMTLTTTLQNTVNEGALKTAEKVLHSVQLEGCNIEPVEAALFCLVYSDRTDQAADLAEALFTLAQRRGSPTWVSALAAFRAHIAERRGTLLEAVKYARIALDTLPQRSLGVLAALPLATLIEAHTEMGEFEEAEQYLRHPLPESALQTRYGLHYLAARGRYHVSVGQPHTGLGDFMKCGSLMRSWEVDTPLLVPWRLGAAGVSVVLKEDTRARKLLDMHYAHPHSDSPRIRGFALMVLASTKELRHRPALLREAIDLFQEGGHSLELAHALARLSNSLATLGETVKARLIGQQADSLSEQFHAEPLRKEIADAFEKGFAAPTGPNARSTLSPAEYRVASMAALGYTNREISKKAHITVSTVEQHLTRIYRKLNVNGRDDLPLLYSAKELRAASKAIAGGDPRRITGSASVAG